MTGQRSNQLNYVPNFKVERLARKSCGLKAIASLHQRLRRLPAWQLSLPNIRVYLFALIRDLS